MSCSYRGGGGGGRQSGSYLRSRSIRRIQESTQVLLVPCLHTGCLLNMIRHSEHLVGSHLSKMLDSLLSGFQAEAEATARDVESDDNEMFAQHRTALEMYAFLMHWFSVAADKFSPKDEDGAAAAKPKVGSSCSIVFI